MTWCPQEFCLQLNIQPLFPPDQHTYSTRVRGVDRDSAPGEWPLPSPYGMHRDCPLRHRSCSYSSSAIADRGIYWDDDVEACTSAMVTTGNACTSQKWLHEDLPPQDQWRTPAHCPCYPRHQDYRPYWKICLGVKLWGKNWMTYPCSLDPQEHAHHCLLLPTRSHYQFHLCNRTLCM